MTLQLPKVSWVYTQVYGQLLWSNWWKVPTTNKLSPHGKCKVIWRRSYQTADLAHWTSKYTNDFLLCSFVSNVCKLLCSKSRPRGASYDREKCAQALLASAAESPWWVGCNRNEWKELQRVNKEGMEFKERLPRQSFVCDHNSCLGCEFVTSVI